MKCARAAIRRSLRWRAGGGPRGVGGGDAPPPRARAARQAAANCSACLPISILFANSHYTEFCVQRAGSRAPRAGRRPLPRLGRAGLPASRRHARARTRAASGRWPVASAPTPAPPGLIRMEVRKKKRRSTHPCRLSSVGAGPGGAAGGVGKVGQAQRQARPGARPQRGRGVVLCQGSAVRHAAAPGRAGRPLSRGGNGACVGGALSAHARVAAGLAVRLAMRPLIPLGRWPEDTLPRLAGCVCCGSV
jgi:hypothetical protein